MTPGVEGLVGRIVRVPCVGKGRISAYSRSTGNFFVKFFELYGADGWFHPREFEIVRDDWMDRLRVMFSGRWL